MSYGHKAEPPFNKPSGRTQAPAALIPPSTQLQPPQVAGHHRSQNDDDDEDDELSREQEVLQKKA